MKKYFIASFAFYIIYNISAVSGAKFTCQRYNEPCTEHDECCTKNCYQSIRLFKGRCKEPIDVFNEASKKNVVSMPDDESGQCAYIKKDKVEDEKLFVTFGPNAAHSFYGTNTKLLLQIYTDHYAETVVAVNDEIPASNTTIMEISEKVAAMLNITEEGTFPCNVVINHDNIFKTYFFCFIPYIIFMAGALTLKLTMMSEIE